MKKELLFVITFLFICCVTIAQSDKEIVRNAREALDKKDFESAFSQVITVKSNKNKKANEILKKAYPGIISKNNKAANAVKFIDKDNDATKCEKYQTMIDAYNANIVADESMQTWAKPDVYKSLSKKKLIDKNITNNTNALNKVKDAMAKKEEARKKDSIAAEVSRLAEEARQKLIADSIAAAKQVVVSTPVTTTGTRYYIIAGSYKEEQDAQAAVNRLKSQGYPSQMVNRNSYGNMRICYNSFEKKEDADKELTRIKSKLQPDAWILEK